MYGMVALIQSIFFLKMLLYPTVSTEHTLLYNTQASQNHMTWDSGTNPCSLGGRKDFSSVNTKVLLNNRGQPGPLT